MSGERKVEGVLHNPLETGAVRKGGSSMWSATELEMGLGFGKEEE